MPTNTFFRHPINNLNANTHIYELDARRYGWDLFWCYCDSRVKGSEITLDSEVTPKAKKIAQKDCPSAEKD